MMKAPENQQNQGLEFPNRYKAEGGGTERNITIDLIKGIGIVLMVVRHARAPYSDFVLLFHMAAFFIASGYLLNCQYAKDTKSVLQFILRKIKGLYFPYLKYSLLFILFNNVFLAINIYTDDPRFLEASGLEPMYVQLSSQYGLRKFIKESIKAVFFRAGTQMGGALWFFQTLFMVLILYIVVEYVLKKLFNDEKPIILIQMILSAIFLLVGCYAHLHNRSFGGLDRAFTVYCLIYIGRILHQYRVIQHMLDRCHEMVLGSGCFLILASGYHRGYISIVGNEIGNPAFYLIMSVAGWGWLYCIAVFLKKHDFKVNRVIAYISQKSATIVALHFLAFKLVNAIAVLIYGMEPYMTAAFPVLMNTGLWWLLYVISGLCIPLLLRKAVSILKPDRSLIV